MSKYLTISLVVVALIAGVGLGYLVSPEYSMASYENAQMQDLGKADKYLDLRYVDAMIAHHKGAIALAEQVTNTSKRKEIRELANEILTNEPKAIDELYKWKKDWYNNSKEVEAKEVPNLGSYDDKLDLRFLNALIAHHQEGIEMVREVRMKSTRNEILNNADAVEEFLNGGVKMLSEWRNEWYISK